jgi:hypothetical protein
MHLPRRTAALASRRRLTELVSWSQRRPVSTAFLVAVALWLLVVAAATVAVRTGRLRVQELASSPRHMADGQLWRLASSAIVVQRPVVASLGALLAPTVLAGVLCGSRTLWTTAAAGHIGGTLCSYSMLAIVRLAQPHAFESRF